MVVLGGGAVSYERGTPVAGGDTSEPLAREKSVFGNLDQRFTDRQDHGQARWTGKICVCQTLVHPKLSTGGMHRVSTTGPLSSELGTHKPVKARFWSRLEPLSVPTSSKPCNLFHPRSEADTLRHASPQGPLLEIEKGA